MNSSIEDRIKKWLEEQGYPLEMDVARAFRERSFAVQQAEFYPDPETGDSREIDVVARLRAEYERRLLELVFPVECKRATSKPWLIFTDRSIRLAGPARVMQRATSKAGREFLRLLKGNRSIQQTGLFSLPKRPGYRLTEAFTSGRDWAYDALMGVTSAARGFADVAGERKVASIYFPLIVVEGRLFECYTDGPDSMNITEVRKGSLVWRNPVLTAVHSIINVVTPDGLEDFMDRAELTAAQLFEQRHSLPKAVGQPPA